MDEQNISDTLDMLYQEIDGDEAVEILNISSYFAPDNIQEEIFLNMPGSENLEFSIKLLKKFALIIDGKAENLFDIYLSVQKMIREILKKQDKEEETLIKSALLLLEKGIDSISVNHAMSVWEHAGKYQEFIKAFAFLPSIITKCLIEQARCEQANIFGWKALDLLKRVVGEHHPRTLDLQHKIGQLLGIEGKYKESLEILLPLLDKDIEFQDQAELRATLTTIARQKSDLSEYEEALRIYHMLLDGKQVSETTDELTLNTWHDFALLLRDIGKFEKAMEILKQVLLKTDSLGVEKDNILQIKCSIAHTFRSQNKFSEALDIYTEISNERTISLGELHPDTLRSKSDLGTINMKMGNYEKATEIFEEVVIKMKEVLGEEHPSTLSCLGNLALTFQFKGEDQKALEIYDKTYQIEIEILGEYNIQTLTTQFNRACTLCNMNKCDEALKNFREVYEGLYNILGENDERTLATKNQIVKLLMSVYCLTTAIKNNSLEDVEKLLKNGVVLNELGPDGLLPLHYAISNGNRDIVRALLKSGASATQVSDTGETTLHIAVLKDFKEIVDDLLIHVIKEEFNKLNDFVNAEISNEKNRVLHVAATNGSLEIIKSLLKYGAIYNEENGDGKIPFDMFKEKSNAADFLKFVDEIFGEVANNDSEIINKLKKTKSDELRAIVNARDYRGNTLYQIAVNHRYDNIAHEMFEIMQQLDQTSEDILNLHSQFQELNI